PIMPLRILKLRTLTGSGVVRGLIITGMFSTFFIGALYLEHVLGYSPIRTGLAFLPQAGAMAVMSAGITARLVTRFGPKPVMYPAMALAVGGLFMLASAGPHQHYFPMIFFAFLILGLGSGVVNVSQQMAGAVGLAVLSTIATNRTKSLLAGGSSQVHALTTGYSLAFFIAAACVLLALVLTPLLLRSSGDPVEGAAHGAEAMRLPEAHEHLVL